MDVTELFKHNSPIAWGIGALVAIVGAILALKNLPAFSSRQVFALLLAIIIGIIVVIAIDKVFPGGPQPKKSLTLWFHENGDVNSRPLYDQGYALLVNDLGEHIEEEIRKQGMVDFVNPPDWVFDAQKGVQLLLADVDSTRFQIVERARFFRANDTFKIELKKLNPVQEVEETTSNPPANNQDTETRKPEKTTFTLVFEHKASNTKMPFDFEKNKTVGELKTHVLSKFKQTLQLGENASDISLVHNGQMIKQEDDSQKLSALNFKDNSVVSISARVLFSLRFKKVAFQFKGKKFDNPTLFINDDKVDAELVKNQPEQLLLSATYSIPEQQDSSLITIRDKSMIYKFKTRVAGLKAVEVDMSNKKGIDLSQLRVIRSFHVLRPDGNK